MFKRFCMKIGVNLERSTEQVTWFESKCSETIDLAKENIKNFSQELDVAGNPEGAGSRNSFMVLNKNLRLSLLLIIKPEEYEIGCGSSSSGGRAEVKVSMSKILNPKMFLMSSLVPCMEATAINI